MNSCLKKNKVLKRITNGKIKSDKIYDEALAKNVITKAEFDQLKKAAELRWNAIQVDDFSQKEYVERRGGLNI